MGNHIFFTWHPHCLSKIFTILAFGHCQAQTSIMRLELLHERFLTGLMITKDKNVDVTVADYFLVELYGRLII